MLETGQIDKNTAGHPSLHHRSTILIIDSGVGGLSVYDEIRKLLPDQQYIYVFDDEGFPYGEKSEDYVIDRIVAIAERIVRRHSIVLAIIACNTASTVALTEMRQRFTFPVIGVVPAIKPAASLTRNGVVGLLATKGTVNRDYTRRLIAQFAHTCHLEMLGSSELVRLAEDKLSGKPLELAALTQILSPWLELAKPPDTIVLGCTHFPLLFDELTAVLPVATRLIDSGMAIARRAVWLLENTQQVQIASETDSPNLAYCTRYNQNSRALFPVLQRYGFIRLQKLT